jgi:hypothetical protein
MKSPVGRFFTQALLGLVVLVFALAAFLFARAAWVFRDRTGGYSLKVAIDAKKSAAAPKPFRVGFARENITPPVGSNLPPVWVAGFSQGRAATGVHDDLFAVATALDDGHARVGLVVLDSIGFFHDDVVAVRRAVPAEAKFDYVIVCATHNHSTPDLMGLWGPHPLKSGVDPAYRSRVIAASAKALADAAKSLQPAAVALHEVKVDPTGLVKDTREPQVFDADLRLMLFTNPTSGAVLGSIVGWGNHPETPWAGNTELTADFCGVIRDGLERGIVYDGQTKLAGLGGTHVYVNACVGGLMTTHPSTTVHDPFLNEDFSKPSHDKTRAVGNSLVKLLLERLASAPKAPAATVAPIGVHAHTLELPLANNGFFAAAMLGPFERGHAHFGYLRTEVAFLTVGDASIACIPGEIYPELVNGGVVRAPGGDFDIEPLEVPPIRDLMPGKVKFLFGLANDEIGYIIPKSEWDEQPPYLFHAKGAPYGEVNSVGPETAFLLHSAMRELIQAAAK